MWVLCWEEYENNRFDSKRWKIYFSFQEFESFESLIQEPNWFIQLNILRPLSSVQIKELYVWFLILLKSSSTYNISTLFYCELYFQLLAFLCQHRRVNSYFVFANRVVTIYIICCYHSYSICFRSWCSVRQENPHDILEKRIAKSGTFNLLK